MPITVVLAIGVDSLYPEAQRSAWHSAGYVVTPTESIRDAIHHFRGGDFDLVLLGQSIPVESRERLTSLIRASGSNVPVICIANSSGKRDSFADATINNDPGNLLQSIGRVLDDRAKKPVVSASIISERTQDLLLRRGMSKWG